MFIEPVPLPANLRPPPWAVLVDYAPNGAPTNDFAGSVTDADRARLSASVQGPVRAESTAIYGRVAQRRELRFPGQIAESADALSRAESWREFHEGAPRIFRIVTDRYLGQIEVGDLGIIVYPAYGLQYGAGVVVLGYAEALSARRLTLTLCTLPEGWVTFPAPSEAEGFLDFILDETGLA